MIFFSIFVQRELLASHCLFKSVCTNEIHTWIFYRYNTYECEPITCMYKYISTRYMYLQVYRCMYICRLVYMSISAWCYPQHKCVSNLIAFRIVNVLVSSCLNLIYICMYVCIWKCILSYPFFAWVFHSYFLSFVTHNLLFNMGNSTGSGSVRWKR